MDYLRSGYRTTMQLEQGGPLVGVVWYRAHEGARNYPTHHHFGSRNWESEGRADPSGQVGESTAKPVYWNSRDPGGGALGLHLCGEPGVFANGATAADPVFAVDPVTGISVACCLVAEIVTSGGAIGDGISVFFSNQQTAAGGAKGGDFAVFFNAELPMSGGCKGDSTASFNALRMAAEGGAESNGAAPIFPWFFLVSTGGGLVNGTNTFQGLNLVASAGAMGEGSALFFVSSGGAVSNNTGFVSSWGAEGGALGNSEASFPSSFIAEGGAKGDHGAEFGVGFPLVSTGGAAADQLAWFGLNIAAEGGASADHDSDFGGS